MLAEQRSRQQAYRLLLGSKPDDEGLVFATPEGQPLRPATVSHAWAKAVSLSGLPVIRLHDARHSHASILLKHGVHPKIVSERLGHASIQITLDLH